MQDNEEQIAFLILFTAACVGVAIALHQIKCMHDSASWCNWICW
jgi:hypothetical protein